MQRSWGVDFTVFGALSTALLYDVVAKQLSVLIIHLYFGVDVTYHVRTQFGLFCDR